MLIVGMLFGFGAAAAHSINYLFSRWYLLRRGDRASARQLLVIAHIWMGLISGAVLGFIWPDRMPPLIELIGPVAGLTGFYLLGQFGVIFAVARTEASRVAPLLGFKVAVLAVISTAALAVGDGIGATEAVGRIYSPLSLAQWAAVGLCVVSVVVLNYSGGSNPPAALVAVMGACGSFALSDTFIRILMLRLEPVGSVILASGVAVSMSFALAGLLSVVLLPWLGSRRPGDWLEAIPFAISWLAAMICLYTAFAVVGLVFGAILQSTRGIMSVLLGAAVAKAGWVALEQRLKRRILVRRLVAAALMTGAIGLYAWAGASDQAPPDRSKLVGQAASASLIVPRTRSGTASSESTTGPVQRRP
jgi:hypothetical protein